MADARPRVLAAAALLCWSLAGPGPASGQESEAAEYRAVVDRYCVACHNARSVAGREALGW